MFRNAVSVAILAATATAVSRAGTLYNETASGDLSNNQAAPTPLIAATGVNSVIGTVGGTDTQDWLALTIPTGTTLSSITLFSYSSTDAQGFMGVQAGSSFVGNPETTPSAYLGYVHYGTGAMNGALPPANLVGTDLLPLMGNTSLAAGSQGFTPPLAAGTYTFLIQQLGAPTSYQFDFTLTPVPEPASLGILSAASIFLLARRRPK
jgi:hypothetical protein